MAGLDPAIQDKMTLLLELLTLSLSKGFEPKARSGAAARATA
jgi:hypothetical protein